MFSNPLSQHLFQFGFTLPELLISLLILGEITTFTIPKILSSQQNSQYNASAKEVVAMISAAYQQASFSSSNLSTIAPGNLFQYMNYVKVDTTSSIDGLYNQGVNSTNCSQRPCILLHGGGILFGSQWNFAGTATTNAINFIYDPDGKVTDGTTTGPGKSIAFYLYANGRIVTSANILPGTTNQSGGTYTADASLDPPWFSW